MQRKKLTYGELKWLVLVKHRKNKPAFVALIEFRYRYYLFLNELVKALQKYLAALQVQVKNLARSTGLP